MGAPGVGASGASGESMSAHSPRGNGGTVMDRAREGAWRQLDTQRERAASGLTSMVDAIRQSGEQLQQQNPTLASYVDTAAGQLQRVTDGLRDKDLEEIVHDLERFARQRPAMFVGGAFVLGLAAARFLKSSGSGDMPTEEEARLSRDTRVTRPYAGGYEPSPTPPTGLPPGTGTRTTTESWPPREP